MTAQAPIPNLIPVSTGTGCPAGTAHDDHERREGKLSDGVGRRAHTVAESLQAALPCTLGSWCSWGCLAVPVSPELLVAGVVGQSNAQILLMVAGTSYCPSQVWEE